MNTLLTTYQRHRSHIEEALVAALLALLAGRFLEASDTVVGEWRIVMTLAIFAVTLYSRTVGYFVAVAALAWPMWFISPYFMAIFLALALLPYGWVIEHLPWVVLVAAAPLLAQWQALALVPLLAGLLAGPTVGMVTGSLAALWLIAASGLAGHFGPLLALHGLPTTVEMVGARAAGANSLEALLLLVEPFSRGSTPLLLALLQAVGWGAAGSVTAWLARRRWRGPEPRSPMVLALAAGALLLWGTLYLLPRWLELQRLSAFLFDPRPAAGIALSAFSAGLIAYSARLVSRPLPARARRDRLAPLQGRRGAGPAPAVAARPSPPPVAEEDDVIMLELD